MSVSGTVIIDGSVARLMREFDDWCGTPSPHRPPIPVPPIPWLRNVLVGVTISRLVSSLESTPIRSELLKLSSELVRSGIERAGSDPMPGIVLTEH
jgi:hypothetical protein